LYVKMKEEKAKEKSNQGMEMVHVVNDSV
jgi:hypothetical protein